MTSSGHCWSHGLADEAVPLGLITIGATCGWPAALCRVTWPPGISLLRMLSRRSPFALGKSSPVAANPRCCEGGAGLAWATEVGSLGWTTAAQPSPQKKKPLENNGLFLNVVEMRRIELLTSALRTQRSPS